MQDTKILSCHRRCGDISKNVEQKKKEKNSRQKQNTYSKNEERNLQLLKNMDLWNYHSNKVSLKGTDTRNGRYSSLGGVSSSCKGNIKQFGEQWGGIFEESCCYGTL